jgi:minor extracellular serine protease Vpr
VHLRPRLRADRLRPARLAAIVAGGMLIAGLAGSSFVTAATPSGAARFTPITGVTPRYLPAGLSSAPATFMLQLAGDPVTVVDARGKLTASQKHALQAQLKLAQAPVSQRASQLGAHVLGSYQLAYNGVKVFTAGTKAAALASIPGVVAIHLMVPVQPDNIHGVPLIGAPAVWDGVAGVHGEGIKIGIIDTGIDYTHADFGGSGNPADYTAAHAAETDPANPAWFGPGAPKVKGGTDLVGDSYNADPNSAFYQPTPHPDPNPLDCFGHGSHVAGTAAGFGVLSDGSTYTGPYDANTVSGHTWNVGPGVAPKADLYAIRVFGCAGSTNEVVDAIEWAVANHMDVINMSLGSPFGGGDDPDAVASDNAAKDGTIVVASAGNNGPNPYTSGTPAAATNAISVAASDPTPSFPGAHLAISTDGTIDAIDANGYPFTDGTAYTVKVIYSAPNVISLGCSAADDGGANSLPPNTIIVVARGTCARVAKAIFGQQAGAAAVIMVNNSASLPPYEGQITGDPDPPGPPLFGGFAYNVTIPFFGVAGGATPSTSPNGTTLRAADGGTITLTNFNLVNPGYLGLASFSSGGPRSGDSWLKPDVTAPGVSIASVGIGTGTGSAIMSGTSMAAPHTTGMAALVRQAHPMWGSVASWKAAIVNTADAGLVTGYSTRNAGSGLIQAPGAVATDVVAYGDAGTATLNYGFTEFTSNDNANKTITVQNFGDTAVTFTLGTTRDAGSPHTVTFSTPTITVGAHRTTTVKAVLKVPVATAGDSSAFNDVAGLITLTPNSGQNHGVALSVPYYLVPLADSRISTSVPVKTLDATGSATATIKNSGGAIAGAADWYSWGLSDPSDTANAESDVRAIGTQSFPGFLVFAVNTYGRWSNVAADEFDIYVDVNGDSHDDYVLFSADVGAVTTGTSNGQAGSFVLDLRTGSISSSVFGADAPFNGTTDVLAARISSFCRTGSPCLSSGNPRITYHAFGFGRDGSVDVVSGTATYNAFTPSLSNGMFDVVDPGLSTTDTVTEDSTEFALTPALGFMIVSHDNPATEEAQLISVP